MSTPRHTISAGGIVINQEGQILIVNQNRDSWSLPKGHIDEGEDALTAARREIYEESGIDQLDLISDLGSYQRFRLNTTGGDDPSELKTIQIFLFHTGQTNLKPIDPANPEACWVEINQVAKLLTHPKDQQFFLSVKDKILKQIEN